MLCGCGEKVYIRFLPGRDTYCTSGEEERDSKTGNAD